MVAGGAAQAGACSAFRSIHRAAMQRGILRLAPEILPAFDFLFGPNVTGRCYKVGGGPEPTGACLLRDGVEQSGVFGPLFFQRWLHELLTGVRERMRDLSVDSTFFGQVAVRLSQGHRLLSRQIFLSP